MAMAENYWNQLSEDTITGGYQAKCHRCGKIVWVDRQDFIYSLLGESCEGLQ